MGIAHSRRVLIACIWFGFSHFFHLLLLWLDRGAFLVDFTRRQNNATCNGNVRRGRAGWLQCNHLSIYLFILNFGASRRRRCRMLLHKSNMPEFIFYFIFGVASAMQWIRRTRTNAKCVCTVIQPAITREWFSCFVMLNLCLRFGEEWDNALCDPKRNVCAFSQILTVVCVAFCIFYVMIRLSARFASDEIVWTGGKQWMVHKYSRSEMFCNILALRQSKFHACINE